MPDILIRGMEMPESCEECVTKHKFFRELKCADLPGMRNFGENRLYTDSRNPHCSINKLPPHGDLISKQTVLAALYSDYAYAAMDVIEEVPVVVPAEKGVE